MKMKNPFFLIATLIIAIASAIGTRCYASGDDPVTIIIDDGDFGQTPIIRSPGLVPIEAAYYASLSSILVDFLYDLGSVSVEIENETTGAYTQTIINANQGTYPFLISGDVGIYQIIFTLPGGHVYTGSFEIE